MTDVAIIGAGAVGLSSAALLKERGHRVRLWSAFESENKALRASGGVTSEGSLVGFFEVPVAPSAQACIEGAEVVMIAAPAFAHSALGKALVPHIVAKQFVVMHSATGMTSLLVARLLAERGVLATMLDLSTSVCTSRKSGPALVKVAPLKPGVDIATLPADRLPDGKAVMESLFGPLFTTQENVLAVSLNNHNAVYHVPAFIFSLADVENGADWNLWSNTTPAIARYVARIDDERLAVAKAYGVIGVPLGDYVRKSVGVVGDSIAEVFAAAAQKRPNPTGPKSLDDRYLTEDVPYGLAFFLALGHAAGVCMPLTEQLLAFVSAVFERDFEGEGSALTTLVIAQRSPAAIVELVQQGFKEKGNG